MSEWEANYFFPACMLSLENVAESHVRESASQKNCDPFHHLAAEHCAFFLILNIHVTLAHHFTATWQFFCKNKTALFLLIE